MRLKQTTLIALFVALAATPFTARADLVEQPVVKLRSLDKVTARTMTFEVRVGSTVKFGPIFIKVQSCRKAPPIEQPESAAFLQIWEVTPKDESKWVYSGWMFASSPALSPMDHPIYDVWVLDCLERKSTDPVPPKAAEAPKAAIDPDTVTDAELGDDAAQPPAGTPPDSTPGITVEGPIVEGPGLDNSSLDNSSLDNAAPDNQDSESPVVTMPGEE